MPFTDNFVKETTSTTGTGQINLDSVDESRQFSTAFSTGGSANFFYAIHHPNAVDEYEYGLGSLADSTTLNRDIVLDSSNSNNLVDFSNGTKVIISEIPSESLLSLHDNKDYVQRSGFVWDGYFGGNSTVDLNRGGVIYVHEPGNINNGKFVNLSAPRTLDLSVSGPDGGIGDVTVPSGWKEAGVIADSTEQNGPSTLVWTNDPDSLAGDNTPTSPNDLPSGYDLFRPLGKAEAGKSWWFFWRPSAATCDDFRHNNEGTWVRDGTTGGYTVNEAFGISTGQNVTADISNMVPPVNCDVWFKGARFYHGSNTGQVGIDSETLSGIDEAEIIFQKYSSTESEVGSPFKLTNVSNQEINLYTDFSSNDRVYEVSKFRVTAP